MRILLEMIPVRLRLEFTGNHVVETVGYIGWKGAGGNGNADWRISCNAPG